MALEKRHTYLRHAILRKKRSLSPAVIFLFIYLAGYINRCVSFMLKTIFLQILSIAKEQFVISLIFFAIIQKGEMEYIEQQSSSTDTFYDSGSEQYQSGPLGIYKTAEAPEVD